MKLIEILCLAAILGIFIIWGVLISLFVWFIVTEHVVV